ncbi:MAG TPA: class I SAM-dependent methyltransferase [Bryobacteraceae bacterium]|nr:class I SAM-dependent methyltransferase [Bryobacteraceae bacterium]
MSDREVRQRELAYHEKLYSGFAQRHFARPAVRLLRCHMVARILHLTGIGKQSRVLSLGCGIGDTELLLAPYVGEVVGVDLSPSAIRQARADAERLSISNARFEEGSHADGEFDAVMAIFFLHHLSDSDLAELPRQVRKRLARGGTFYSLDPSRHRLSGALGRVFVPWMMKRYQSPDERELEPEATCRVFRAAGFEARAEMYDFGSTPLAGLLPGWGWGYGFAREFDDWLLGFNAFRKRGSNFEIVASQGPDS